MEWSKGFYLDERASLYEEALHDADDGTEGAVQQWCDRTGIPEALLGMRLAQDGLGESAFRWVLASRGLPQLPTREVGWVRLLGAIFASDPARLEERDLDDPEMSRNPFLDFIRPFLEWAKADVATRYAGWAAEHPRMPFPERAVRTAVLRSVGRSLLSLAGRVLVYELNRARIEGRLVGGTPQARFDDFIQRFATERGDILRLLGGYPVLARLMAEGTQRGCEALYEAFERFLEDREAIERHFVGDFSRLRRLSTGMGDPHRDGRGVLVLEFASGDRLVYKPRSLAIDEHFCQLLSWLNERGVEPAFESPRVLDRGPYGWQEFVAAAPCRDLEGVNRFYSRLGGYLAVLHMLHATDMHMENVIAHAEHPCLVDLESLFQNHDLMGDGELTALRKTSDRLARSVLRIGILPAALFKSGVLRGVELSGIGGHAGQRLPKPTYGLEHERTDRMRVVRRIGFSKGATNRPLHAGEEVSPEEHTEDIVDGFERVYGVLLRHRDELLAEKGPIMAFRRDEVRSIVRHTQSYGTMLEAALHPDYLRDGLDRVRLLDYMWRATRFNERLADLVPSETRDLLRGDIPLFGARADSRSLWDSRGREISGFFRRSALDLVKERVRDLGEEDRAEQVRYIRTSMATMLKRWDLKENRRDFSHRKMEEPLDDERFVEAAVAIGERLLGSSYWGEGGEDVNWIGVGASLDDRWMFTPLDASMYDGILGVALFYAHLADVSGQDRYERVARAALRSAREFLQRPEGLQSLSAYHGYASVAYVLGHLSSLWNDDSVLQEALAALTRCEELIGKDRMFDLIAGTAGTLLVALRLNEFTGSERALRIAVRCGEHLLENAEALEVGCGWISGLEGETPLVGLSHGAAGIAWALAELYARTGDERYLACSRAAMDYERTTFIPEEGNWADLRYRDVRRSMGIANPVQWCHGAAGIALSRLMMLRHCDDGQMREEIRVATETTIREGFGGSHCQCHGDFGNLEVLLLGADVLGDGELRERALWIASAVLREAEEKGWSCGIPQEEDTPSLMLGLAGIGYGLLRLAAPGKVPPVVVLALPERTGC